MTIKIGMLGAARIGREGLVRPARKVEGIELYAVAARDGDSGELPKLSGDAG